MAIQADTQLKHTCAESSIFFAGKSPAKGTEYLHVLNFRESN